MPNPTTQPTIFPYHISPPGSTQNHPKTFFHFFTISPLQNFTPPCYDSYTKH